MTINLINPNFNLINNAKTAATGQNGSTAADALNGVQGGVRSFSDVLESAVSNLQNSLSEGNAASGASSGTVNLDEIFQKASDTYNVPVQLLKAVAKAESNFNPTSQSSSGAQGIMQLMPGTAKSLGVTDSFDPEQNIMGGAKYLSQQLARYDGNPVLALAAYNAGPGNVAKYNGVPPFKETQNYVTKVMAYAGEPITAGNAVLTGQATPSLNSGTALQGSVLGLMNADSGSMDIKDYELLLNLYRYKMQLNVLTDSDSDSNAGADNLLGSLTGLV